MFSYLINKFSNKQSNDLSTFKNILHIVPSSNALIKEKTFIMNDILIECIKTFCIINNKNKNNKIIVSLSGGVDSMVLIAIIHYLGYDVIAAHINYNNRNETVLEEQFIKNWCYLNGIKLHVKKVTEMKRETSKRSEYENFTKNLRYNFYKEILKSESCEYIVLGHHKDDIVENIFANVCRGRYLLDLAVIKEQAIINDVNIFRPMIQFYKSYICEFATKHDIPYFKDTTPLWSVRGKYRTKIFPELESAFTTNVKDNLIGISQQSDDWNKLITKEILDPFLASIKYFDTYVTFNVESYQKYPLCFWNIAFMKIFYHFGKYCPSRKGIQTFMNSISSIGHASISNTCICYIKNYEVKIDFKLKI